jgi:hypothetical protein
MWGGGELQSGQTEQGSQWESWVVFLWYSFVLFSFILILFYFLFIHHIFSFLLFHFLKLFFPTLTQHIAFSCLLRWFYVSPSPGQVRSLNSHIGFLPLTVFIPILPSPFVRPTFCLLRPAPTSLPSFSRVAYSSL